MIPAQVKRGNGRWLAAILAAVALFAIVNPVSAEQSRFSLADWQALAQERKAPIIQGAIELHDQHGTAIRRPAEFYVRELDALAEKYRANGNPHIADPVAVAFQSIALMEGDWDNGEDPLLLAQQFMGEAFAVFQQRFPEKYQHLVELSEARSR